MTALITSWATAKILGMDTDLTCSPSCRFASAQRRAGG